MKKGYRIVLGFTAVGLMQWVILLNIRRMETNMGRATQAVKDAVNEAKQAVAEQADAILAEQAQTNAKIEALEEAIRNGEDPEELLSLAAEIKASTVTSRENTEKIKNIIPDAIGEPPVEDPSVGDVA